MFQTLACAPEATRIVTCACSMPRRNWAGFHAPWQWKIHHQPKKSSWMNYLLCLTNHGVPHVFARRPAVTNLNAQAPGLDPALFASGLALGTQNQGEPKMIQKNKQLPVWCWQILPVDMSTSRHCTLKINGASWRKSFCCVLES